MLPFLIEDNVFTLNEIAALIRMKILIQAIFDDPSYNKLEDS
jgi:hypothetical protein